MTAGTAPAIRFRCPHCRRSVRVAGWLGGRHGRCPKCEGAVRVPETPVGDKVMEVLSAPLAVVYTVQWAICGAAILWAPLVYDGQGFAHLLPFAWALLAIVGLGLVALQLMVGLKRVTLGSSGLIVDERRVRWKDVTSLQVSTSASADEQKELDGIAELSTKSDTHQIPHSYCLDAGDHWIRLLDPRYRPRKTRELADSIQALFGAKKTKSHRRMLARDRAA